MTLASTTVEWNEITTRHLRNYGDQPGYKDNFHKGLPLLELLRERKMTMTGGERIAHRVNFAGQWVGKSIRKGSKLDLTDAVNETQAEYDWAVIEEPWVLYFHDLMKAEGNGVEGVLSLAEDKMGETDKKLREHVLTQLCRSSKTESIDLNTILEAVATSGAFGGLNPATAGQDLWASQATGSIDFSAVGVARMRRLAHLSSQGGRYRPDALLLPRVFFEEACESVDAGVVFNQNVGTKYGTKATGIGVRDVAVADILTFWDYTWSSLQSATGVMMNFDGLHLVENGKWAFSMTPVRDGYANGLDAQVAFKRYVGQLTVSNRGIQGLTTLT